jgi:hypothetical protein
MPIPWWHCDTVTARSRRPFHKFLSEQLSFRLRDLLLHQIAVGASQFHALVAAFGVDLLLMRCR